MAGMEMQMASTMATFIQVQKASVGEVNTSSVFSLASGLEMKRMAGSVTKNAMTSPTPAEPSAHTMRVRSSPRCSMNDILPRARSCSRSGAGCSSVITTPSGSARHFPRPAVHCQELPTSAPLLLLLARSAVGRWNQDPPPGMGMKTFGRRRLARCREPTDDDGRARKRCARLSLSRQNRKLRDRDRMHGCVQEVPELLTGLEPRDFLRGHVDSGPDLWVPSGPRTMLAHLEPSEPSELILGPLHQALS